MGLALFSSSTLDAQRRHILSASAHPTRPMSKAFTRESDAENEIPEWRRPSSALPPGTPNYMTSDGAARFRKELEQRIEIDRPALLRGSSSLTNAADSKAALARLDARIEGLQDVLRTAVVVPPPAGSEDRVLFGATVTIRDSSEELITYRIVGVDETDIDRGWISWISPLSKALLNKRRGEKVPFKFPSGQKTLEILDVTYEG